MSCKSRLDDLLFGTGGNSITEITKNAKEFAAEAVSEWPKIVTRIYKKRSQKIIDFIRAKAPWLPGGQHGDDIGTVLDDDEYARFQAVCDTITKRFAEDGKYTRYIDAEELSLYFRDNPLFFKEGYTQAIMDTTGHVRDHAFDPTFVGDHITKFTKTEATNRRTQWHAFIDDLQQGLIDEFGEVRGRKLADDLGITAAKDAHEVNAIIFKWGKKMWDSVYSSAKAAGATDEEATALAKIAASGCLNGHYVGTAPVGRGVPGWISKHPLWAFAIGTIGVIGIARMLIWWYMDNYPFHIWLGRHAGVLEKTYGDQANEVVRRLNTMGYQFRDFPCNTIAQQNYVDMLVELKRLKEIADTSDPVPADKIGRYKLLYSVVYGKEIGDPNEFERTMVYADYASYTNEYNLRVNEENCIDPIEPPDGWAEVTTGTLLVTASIGGFSVYLDEAASASCTTYGKDDKDCEILNVPIGERIIEVRKEGYTSCKETITITAGANEYHCDLVEEACIPAVPKITAPTKATEKESVSFKGSATTESTITWWEWDFGDGGKRTTQSPSYVFFNAGTWIVKLTVTDDCGTVTTTHTIVIEEEAPPPGEEAATMYVEMPIDMSVAPPVPLVWPDNPEVYVDGQYERKVPGSIAFGGFGQPAVKGCTLMVRATGYQDTSKWFDLKDKDSLTWQPKMYPVDYVPPVDKFPINFYIPAGAVLSEPVKEPDVPIIVSRLVTGMRRIGRQ